MPENVETKRVSVDYLKTLEEVQNQYQIVSNTPGVSLCAPQGGRDACSEEGTTTKQTDIPVNEPCFASHSDSLHCHKHEFIGETSHMFRRCDACNGSSGFTLGYIPTIGRDLRDSSHFILHNFLL